MQDGSQGGVTSRRWGNAGWITERGDRRVSHAQPKHRALYRQVPSLPFPEAAAETALLCWGQFNLLTTVLQCQCNGGGGGGEAKRRVVQLVNYRVTMSQCQFNGGGGGGGRDGGQFNLLNAHVKKKSMSYVCVCVGGGSLQLIHFSCCKLMLYGGKGGEQLTFFTNHDGSLCPVWRGQFNLLMYCRMCSVVVIVCVCVCGG